MDTQTLIALIITVILVIVVLGLVLAHILLSFVKVGANEKNNNGSENK